MKTNDNFLIEQLDAISSVECSCGAARRAFASAQDRVASVHLVDVRKDAKAHYHRKLTEIYVVLEGNGFIELDGERHPVKPMSAILIRKGCRHRAIGKLRILNIPIPAYDVSDEWFDE